MNRFKELCKLYWAFFKIGGLTFGGGLTMLPMLEHELVDKNNWISEEELLDIYAIGQCTPGIIAINTATFVGYKKQKVWGGIFSTLGMVTPSLVIITVIAAFLNNFMDNVWFQHALMGIRGVVCALLINTAINLAKKSLKNLFTWIIYVIILLIGLFLKVPTIILVLSAAAVGIIYSLIKTLTAKKSASKNTGTLADSKDSLEPPAEKTDSSEATENISEPAAPAATEATRDSAKTSEAFQNTPAPVAAPQEEKKDE